MDMNLRYFIVQYPCPLLEKVIHRAVDHGFVAGDWRCRYHDGISGMDVNVGMGTICHAHQRRGWLTLAAGGNKYYLIVRETTGFINSAQDSVRSLNITELQRHAYRIIHAASDNENTPPVLGSRINHLLDARYQRGKGGDDHSPRGITHDMVQGLSDHLLRRRVAGKLGICGVGKKE
ncbi:hypothetical protein ES703_49804 [subsurface metagenome]